MNIQYIKSNMHRYSLLTLAFSIHQYNFSLTGKMHVYNTRRYNIKLLTVQWSCSVPHLLASQCIGKSAGHYLWKNMKSNGKDAEKKKFTYIKYNE